MSASNTLVRPETEAQPLVTDGDAAGSGAVVKSAQSGVGTAGQASERVNPFRAVAMLLSSLASSLEAAKLPDAPPRWVRVVRIREYTQGQDVAPIAGKVRDGIAILLNGLSLMVEITLRARELLRQVDAIKALAESSHDLVNTIANPDFINAITQVVGVSNPIEIGPLDMVRSISDTVFSYVDKVPEPEDLDLIGQQLYRMLAVVHTQTASNDAELNLDRTGKLRLIQLGLALPWTVRIGGAKLAPQSKVIVWLGMREVTTGATTLASLAVKWGLPGHPEGDEVVVANDETDPEKAEAGEASMLLEALGYRATTLGENVRQFQRVNHCDPTGQLDAATANRLLNLVENKLVPGQGNVSRALPYDGA